MSCADTALRPRSAASWAALERTYREQQLVVLDDFLTDDALAHLLKRDRVLISPYFLCNPMERGGR